MFCMDTVSEEYIFIGIYFTKDEINARLFVTLLFSNTKEAKPCKL